MLDPAKFYSKSELADELRLSWSTIRKRIHPEIARLETAGYCTRSKMLSPKVWPIIRELVENWKPAIPGKNG